MGKGKIAPYEQFLLFLSCFQKTCTADMLIPCLFWKGLSEMTRIHLSNHGRNIFAFIVNFLCIKSKHVKERKYLLSTVWKMLGKMEKNSCYTQ